MGPARDRYRHLSTTARFCSALFLAAGAISAAPAAAQPRPLDTAIKCDTVVPPTKQEKKVSKIDAALAKVDKTFGEVFVGPLASVLFYDLLRSDNAIDEGVAEEVVGQVIRGKEYVGYDADKNQFTTKIRYKTNLGRLALAPAEQKPAPENEYRSSFGGIRLKISGGETPSTAMASVVEGPFVIGERKVVPFASYLEANPAAFTLEPAELEALKAKGEAVVVVTDAAPFPVIVVKEGEGATLVSTSFSAEPLLVKKPLPAPRTISPGETVWVGDTNCKRKDVAEVVSVNKIDENLVMVELRSTVTGTDKTNPVDRKLPFIVVWLVIGAIFFTVRMAFINLRGMRHAIDVVRGEYDDPDHEGEISHFQALSSALSATVGLGNIAGVAIAVGMGGPGAVFWMVIAGVFGMSSKFVECTLGQMYRTVDDNGTVLGGPMRYLRDGLDELADESEKSGGAAGIIYRPLGMALSVLFAVMCIGGSFGGGNMFQSNQAFAVLSDRIPAIADYGWVFGLVMAVLVGLVIIGGIKRIGAAAGFLVPLMCGIYLVAGFYILIVNAGSLGWAFGVIVGEAFTPQAGLGGLVGVLIIGFQRAAFSNEAGVGSAAIAHSAAATDEPVSEGIVALLEPFIDTILVCTMTGLVVVVTGAYQVPGVDGVVMTSLAFESALPWFPWVLTVAVVLFAFSTMISWSYYGERSATRLFGPGISLPYRAVFCVFVFFGAVFKLGNVLDFSDLMVLGMAFPNILGAVLLSGKVKRALDNYWSRYKSGALKKHGDES